MPIEKDKLQEIFKKLPPSPGIYRMIDQEGRVIYIGKAKDLKKRVKQYFQKNYQHSTRTLKMIENIANIEFTTVDTELEAIILETNLIKQFLPKYNIIMKDDKNFVYIKITNETYPRIQIVRKVEKDKAKYYGPKTAAHKVKETFKVLKKIFPFRHCSLDLEYIKPGKIPNEHEVKVTRKTMKYPCLDYFIKRCPAPCIGKISPAEYQKVIKNIESFLEGKEGEILQTLNEEMMRYAREQKFEKAAKTRDKINKIKQILEKQKVADPGQTDKDIINYLVVQDQAYFNLFQIRDGKLLGQENFILHARDRLEGEEDMEVLEAFLNQYYELAQNIPQEIIIPHEIIAPKAIEKFIHEESGKNCHIIIPQRGTKNKLLEMSLNNARIFADRNKPSWKKESEITGNAVLALQKTLKLEKPIKRIECFDISHLSGTDTVGSMIVFENGVPKNNMYRKFHLRTVQNKPDDFKSMQEVLMRRFSKIAMDMHQTDYTFKKATKKDHPDITDRAIFTLLKNKKIVGTIGVKEYEGKICELTNLWLDENERGHKLGYKLIKEALKKTSSKRAYIICRQDLKEYYQLAGFEEVSKLPPELEERGKDAIKEIKHPLFMLFEKRKHKEDESFSKIPDLVVIDGGKPQLSAATAVFAELKLDIKYISLAKKMEEIFIPDQEKSVLLEKNNDALKLLQRARDEAHRFAISYNKNLRGKRLKM